MHARRTRPDAGTLDRRRLLAAGLSTVLPGLGQALNRRRRLALAFLLPTVALAGIAAVLWASQSPARLTAWAVTPSVMGSLLALNVLVLLFRLASVGQAFADTRLAGPSSRLGIIGMVLLAAVIVLPHMIVWRYGQALEDTFARVFDGGALGGQPGASGDPVIPLGDERINILLVGLDKTPWRTATLTDSMMVVSVDPVGKTVSMLSLPRDLINVPLGNGDVYGPKLNSLLAYADRHPEAFPAGGMRTLMNAVGALLDVRIPYYASIDLLSFVDLVDAVGGVDVHVERAFDDPLYTGWGKHGKGWSIAAGDHHLDGYDALAYARARRGTGESDFTRAGRQQEVLLALKRAVTKDGSLLWKLPQLLDIVGDTIDTNVPVRFLPSLAAVSDEIDAKGIVRVVLRHPLMETKTTKYGYSLEPDVEAIRAVAAKLFPEPGAQPLPWPTPEPTPVPKASARPTASP